MAIDFFRSPETLVRDLTRRGWSVQSVETSGGTPPRAAQIRLDDGVTVNWDRDSRSVWAEGPWPDAQKVENSLRRFYSGRISRRFRAHPVKAGVVVAMSIALGVACGFAIRAIGPKMGFDSARHPAVTSSDAAP
jgi:hypothetical protein